VNSIGDHLRAWRRRRRLSQLDLAVDAEVSPRHLSFIESGRSRPSREMVLHLAEALGVPMRERNAMLLAAGFAPVFAETPLKDPSMAAVRKAIDQVLDAQRPYPAFALDRHWTVVASNAALPELYVGCSEALLEQPINAMRLSLHPDGVAPRIANYGEWRAHLIERLKRQIDLTADPVLIELMAEVNGYPPPSHAREAPTPAEPALVIPFRVITEIGLLSFLSTTTVFGTPRDVTLDELALELFFPADAATAQAVQTRGAPAVTAPQMA
jgi:transcriptional regulator with XRE-family HTH domain